MRPSYVNVFGVRKATDKEGNILEVTLDASCKYMETSVAVTPQGMENISAPAVDPVVSLVMNRQSALALANLLIKTLNPDSED